QPFHPTGGQSWPPTPPAKYGSTRSQLSAGQAYACRLANRQLTRAEYLRLQSGHPDQHVCRTLKERNPEPLAIGPTASSAQAGAIPTRPGRWRHHRHQTAKIRSMVQAARPESVDLRAPVYTADTGSSRAESAIWPPQGWVKRLTVTSGGTAD